MNFVARTSWAFLELGGPLSPEALGSLPTLPKVKAGTGVQTVLMWSNVLIYRVLWYIDILQHFLMADYQIIRLRLTQWYIMLLKLLLFPTSYRTIYCCIVIHHRQYIDISTHSIIVTLLHTQYIHGSRHAVHFFEVKNERQSGISIICWKPNSHLGLCIEWKKSPCIDSIEAAIVTNKNKLHNTLCYSESKV